MAFLSGWKPAAPSITNYDFNVILSAKPYSGESLVFARNPVQSPARPI
jgi:hypothetical protein